MQQFLEDLYTNPETGFIGRDALYRKAKQINPKVDRKDIKEFYDNYTNTQIHYPKKQPMFSPILGNVGFYQIDLIFYPKYKRQNRGYSGALIAVGVNSRYAYGYAFKKKTAENINEILQRFIDDAAKEGRPVLVVESDNGSEFTNKAAQTLFLDNHIVHNTTEPGNHRYLGKIDRFSRTIKSYISKYMTENDTVNWIDEFQKLLKNYNSTYHTAIHMAPRDVTSKKEAKILQRSESAVKKSRKGVVISIGDHVEV
jgi:hypothetical protein